MTATFGILKAHSTVRVDLTIRTPLVDVATQIKLNASANGSGAHKGNSSQATVVAPTKAVALFLPSQQFAHCGQMLDSNVFGSDDTAQLTESLACETVPFGVCISTSEVTFDSNKQKNVGGQVTGNAGIVIGADATDATIIGGGTDGPNDPVEYISRTKVDKVVTFNDKIDVVSATPATHFEPTCPCGDI